MMAQLLVGAIFFKGTRVSRGDLSRRAPRLLKMVEDGQQQRTRASGGACFACVYVKAHVTAIRFRASGARDSALGCLAPPSLPSARITML